MFRVACQNVEQYHFSLNTEMKKEQTILLLLQFTLGRMS